MKKVKDILELLKKIFIGQVEQETEAVTYTNMTAGEVAYEIEKAGLPKADEELLVRTYSKHHGSDDKGLRESLRVENSGKRKQGSAGGNQQTLVIDEEDIEKIGREKTNDAGEKIHE